ncbi:E3 ubiquitin-protein ligase RNF169 isoform X3 [Mus musculus]|uniref:E3 ubiquitin-protein ligase RNF169 isoform X3 n=1 Tax=Mus musculus TaxID=10090 RepID=UPI0003D74A6D|nr:E3 ubiquitin-protein ligase RNF169 isoform X3 [Mus musculus]|eukprot:XP_006507251.1 PREDICTED: E3 ubiquitin-protein ligase RNF169 isoform X3 [Mus musculus]
MNMQIAVRRALPRPLLLSHRNRLSLQTGNKMAAAGPSTRASSAAAAAALSRRGRRGRCDEMAAAKAGAPGPASSPALLVLRSAPRPEESGCTGCLETPGEVAALPCSHSRCRGCASRAAGPGCRRCRPRGSGWARRRARDDGQAAAELMGERARRGQPEPCRPRRDGGAAASGPRPEPEPLAEPEFIFRTPIKLSKPGELSEEYGCLRKLRGEKLQEEKDCDDQIHKLLQEDSEMGKRKADEQKKRDEAVVLKTSLEQVSGSRMSGGHCLEQVSGSRMSGGHCLEQVSGSRMSGGHCLEQVSGSHMSGGHCLEQVSGSRMSGGHCLEQVSGSRMSGGHGLEQVSGSCMSGGHCLEQVSGSRMSGGHCLEQVSGSRLVDICLREPCLADHGTRNTH